MKKSKGLIIRSLIMMLLIITAAVSSADFSYAADLSNAVPEVKVKTYKDCTRISWNKISGTKVYRIYRATSLDGKYKVIGKVKARRKKLRFDDKKAKSGKVYYYKVRAYRGKKHSLYSEAACHRTVYRVFIACGHGTDILGRWDTGCTYKGMQEAKLMLPITKAFVKNARKAGIYVYTDADNGNNMNRDKCIAAANKHDLSAYVSIHCDWEKADPGTLPLYLSKEDMKLAEALNRSVLRNIDIVTRGLERRTDLLELSRTKAVSCTFETGCISKDYVILQTQYKEYGKALAEGLCDYLGITSD